MGDDVFGLHLDLADIYRLAGDGMSWEDTMAHIDQVLNEGEHHPNVRRCEECGAPSIEQHVIDNAGSDIGNHHADWCSLHPRNIS